MKRLVLALTLVTALAAPAFARQPKTYQVTGKVVELADGLVVVEKADKEKWELALGPDTKVTGTLKVGEKVTIQYRMVATTAEAKGGK
jgi:hypothetical protein